MDIIKGPFIEDKRNKRLFIDNLLCKCLYEYDSLMNISSFQHSYKWIIYPETKFDFYILGYLVAAHNITYEVTFHSLHQLHAFKGGLQFHSNIHVNGKLRINIKSGEWDLKEFLFIPSHAIVAFIGIDESFKESSFPIQSNALLLSAACEFISQFQLLQELSIKIDFPCSSEKVHPLLELKTLYKLTLRLKYNLYDTCKLLNSLTAPGRSLKILHIKYSETFEYHYIEGNVHVYDELYCIRQFPSLIHSQTSLEELNIDDIVVWHKSNNSLVIYYEYQIIEKSPDVTVKLTSITSFTCVTINKKLSKAKITIYSEPVMSELSNFVSAFEKCRKLLKSSNFDHNVVHRISLNTFMYALVSLKVPTPFRYSYKSGPCHRSLLPFTKNTALFLFVSPVGLLMFFILVIFSTVVSHQLFSYLFQFL